jgi:hypothetical protein
MGTLHDLSETGVSRLFVFLLLLFSLFLSATPDSPARNQSGALEGLTCIDFYMIPMIGMWTIWGSAEVA